LKPPTNTLSHRELECLLWIGRGKTYDQTGEILGLSFASVKTYLDGARRKLDAVNLVHAIVIALAEGILTYDQLLRAKVDARRE
jgi:DNA-binding CsgD family transcriptional regulator